jgi:pentatricopeptide repeat protein
LAKVAAFVDALGTDAADILGLFLETCLRSNHADVLKPCLRRQRTPLSIPVRDAITYAHLIRAYGVVEDVDGAWHAWNEMRSRRMTPLKVTLGCMVQALVVNKDVEAGYALVRALNDDSRSCGLATAVTYNSLLKGFVAQKMFERAWSVYAEMCDRNVELTVATFNTLIDGCARCCRMDRIEGVLEDMDKQSIAPDMVTYSTIIKGLCHDSRLQEALDMKEKLRQNGHSVDGHAYAALLDGCSRLRKWELGFELINDMRAERVAANNLTLTALFRLAGRSQKSWALDRAFDLCGLLARDHKIRLNAVLYKNMATACVSQGDRMRALKVLAQAARAGCSIDAAMYEPVLVALASERDTLRESVSLLCMACGLRVPHSDVHALLCGIPADAFRVHNGLCARLVEQVLVAMAEIDRPQAIHLVRRLERESALRLDNRLKLSLASAAGKMS